MDKLYFQYWAINSNENLSNIIKICPIRYKILPNTKKASQNSQRLLKFCQSGKKFVKSGHTGSCYRVARAYQCNCLEQVVVVQNADKKGIKNKPKSKKDAVAAACKKSKRFTKK